VKPFRFKTTASQLITFIRKSGFMNTTLKNTGEIRNRRKESRIMKRKSITFVVLFGLWTAFTLAESVWGYIFLAGPNSITRLDVIPSNNIPAGLIVAFSIYLCGGGLWGLGIARLMNGNAKSMVKACALSWSATGFVIAIALGFSLPQINRVISRLPHCCHTTHYFFLSIFVPVIGIVTAINAYVATSKLGYHELKKSAGMYAGIAAALGFLAIGLILSYGFGWEVGEPVPGKYGMLKLTLFCSIGGALAGGMAIGWVLEKSRIGLDG
jgi:hypothetical protein